ATATAASLRAEQLGANPVQIGGLIDSDRGEHSSDRAAWLELAEPAHVLICQQPAELSVARADSGAQRLAQLLVGHLSDQVGARLTPARGVEVEQQVERLELLGALDECALQRRPDGLLVMQRNGRERTRSVEVLAYGDPDSHAPKLVDQAGQDPLH